MMLPVNHPLRVRNGFYLDRDHEVRERHASAPERPAGNSDLEALTGAAAELLDSVCEAMRGGLDTEAAAATVDLLDGRGTDYVNAAAWPRVWPNRMW